MTPSKSHTIVFTRKYPGQENKVITKTVLGSKPVDQFQAALGRVGTRLCQIRDTAPAGAVVVSDRSTKIEWTLEVDRGQHSGQSGHSYVPAEALPLVDAAIDAELAD